VEECKNTKITSYHCGILRKYYNVDCLYSCFCIKLQRNLLCLKNYYSISIGYD